MAILHLFLDVPPHFRYSFKILFIYTKILCILNPPSPTISLSHIKKLDDALSKKILPE